jgi:hypothetical protein
VRYLPASVGCYATFLHNIREDLPKAEEYYAKATKGSEAREPIVFQFGVLLEQLGRSRGFVFNEETGPTVNFVPIGG